MAVDCTDTTIPESEFSSLIDFLAEKSDTTAPWSEYVWDARRRFPGSGRDEVERWAFLVSPDDDDGVIEWVRGAWETADRPFEKRTDALLINLARDCRDRGWKPRLPCRSRLTALLPLRMHVSLQFRRVEPPNLSKNTKNGFASGAEDTFPALLEAWKSQRQQQRAAAEREWDAITARFSAVTSSPHSTDAEIDAATDAFEAAIADWHRRYDSLFPKAPPSAPPPQGLPMPAGYMPLLNTQSVVADLGRPIVDAFLANQSGRPAIDAPKLPDVKSAHPLFESLNQAIAHVVATAEHSPKTFRATGAVDMLAVLSAVNQQVYETVCARIRGSGAALPDSRLNAAVRRIEAQVARNVRVGAGWATDTKGMPDASNSDNVAVFLNIVGAEVRWNAWSSRAEIRWSATGEWHPLQERDLNSLLTTAANGQHNFRPRESMFKRALNALAHETTFDPVIARLAAAQDAWDGTPRLDAWLATAIGSANDAYLTAVGRNVIGGMVKRARRPGVKHDEVLILIGPEDTLKSTLCRTIALDDDWFTDSVAFEGSPQNIVPQLFGKMVVELAELDGMARREVQYIKRFLSAQSDNVTLKYEAFASDHERRCIFIGTSNESNPPAATPATADFARARGATDRRRFVRDNLDQIIGEAAVLEAAGDLFLIPRELIPEARARQEDARAEADFEIHLNAWFAGKTGAAYILPADLATLLKEVTGRSIPSNQYGAAMKRLGFVQLKPRLGASREQTRVWCRGGIDGAQRYSIHRGGDGRAFPKLPFLATPPVPAGSAVVLPLPMARMQ